MILIMFLLSTVVSAARFTIDKKTQSIRDLEGRHTIFHGVNAVYKVAPYIPEEATFDSQDSFTEADIQNLADWGFNFVRLGVMWEAVERSPGQYNDTYLSQVSDLITRLGKKGIHTMIDAHQDIFARKICGEGMPNFYAKQILDKGTYCLDQKYDFILEPVLKKFGYCKSIDDYDLRYDADGNPLIEDCQKYNFAAIYTSPEGLSIQRAFYFNDLGIQDKFAAFWKHVATKLSSNEYIVAFDPLNEPAPAGRNLSEWLHNWAPGHLDSTMIAPLYERLFKDYQSVDPQSIMAFEPTPMPPDVIANVGFKTPPGGNINSAHHIMNEHTYCCGPLTSICIEPSDSHMEITFWKTFCNYFHEYKVWRMGQDARKLEIPLLISEFGACTDVGPCVTEITQVTERSDEVLGSWAYWQYKTFHDLTTTAGTSSEGFYNKDGSLQANKLKSLSRTYVQYAQGELVAMEFRNPNAGYGSSDGPKAFSADIKIDTTTASPTVVYASINSPSEYTWYPHGYDIAITGKNTTIKPVYKLDGFKNHITIQVTNQEFNGQTLNIKITPKEK